MPGPALQPIGSITIEPDIDTAIARLEELEHQRAAIDGRLTEVEQRDASFDAAAQELAQRKTALEATREDLDRRRFALEDAFAELESHCEALDIEQDALADDREVLEWNRRSLVAQRDRADREYTRLFASLDGLTADEPAPQMAQFDDAVDTDGVPAYVPPALTDIADGVAPPGDLAPEPWFTTVRAPAPTGPWRTVVGPAPQAGPWPSAANVGPEPPRSQQPWASTLRSIGPWVGAAIGFVALVLWIAAPLFGSSPPAEQSARFESQSIGGIAMAATAGVIVDEPPAAATVDVPKVAPRAKKKRRRSSKRKKRARRKNR